MDKSTEQREQELRENLAEIIYGKLTYSGYLSTPSIRQHADEKLDQILALIRRAGYQTHEEVQNLCDLRGELATMEARRGYVKMDKDQSLDSLKCRYTYDELQTFTDMAKEAGWRKVEVKDEQD